MGLQCNVSGDYYSYMEDYNKLKLFNADVSQIRSEVGWFYLMKVLSQFFSFEFFVFFISTIEYLILSCFINKYVDKDFRYVAGLIFFFFMNMMLFQMKGMRQGFAIELFLASFMLVDSKKYLLALSIALLSVFIHKTSIVVIPFLLLIFLSKQFGWCKEELRTFHLFLPIIITTGYIIFILNKLLIIEYLQPIFMALSLMDLEGYFGEMSYTDQHVLIYIYGAVTVFFMSYYLKFAKGNMRVIVILAIIGQFAGDFFLGQGDLFRIPLYYSIFSIVAIPNAASHLYRKKQTKLSFLFVLLCIGYAWRTFMPWVYRPVLDGFYTYRFVFE